MFSNPLKQAAEEYLYTSDTSIRERTEQKLIRAGAKAVAPLIDALVVTFRKLNSASWGKKEMDAYADAIEGYLGDQFAERLRQQIGNMPDRKSDGMSMAQLMFSREACDKAWLVISQIGETGIGALFKLINGRDKNVRLAAMLTLNMEENPSRFILNSLITSAPFQDVTKGSEIEAATQMLVLRMMDLGGNHRASEVIREFCRANNMSEYEFQSGIIDQCVYLLAKSK